MRAIYSPRSAFALKKASIEGTSTKDTWQAGKSVAAIHRVEPVGEIVKRFGAALD